MINYKRLSHSVWYCKYHIVFCPKWVFQAFYMDKRSIYARRGFDISRSGESDYGWFLEEVIAKYYSYLFVKKLLSNGEFADDLKRIEKKVQYFKAKGRYKDGKVIFSDDRFFADPYLCFLIKREN